MTTLREAAQQALDALELITDLTNHDDEIYDAIDALKAALVEDAMQKFTDVNQEIEAALAEPVQEPVVNQQLTTEPVQEPDPSRCPKCGGPADNGHDREMPPNAYHCTKCMAEPVAWRFEARHIDSAWAAAVTLKHPGPEGVYMRNVMPLYTAPPQRKPLSKEEIKECERQAMVNGSLPFEQRVFFARAIERAHGIGGAAMIKALKS